jgi:hypothetical protein
VAAGRHGRREVRERLREEMTRRGFFGLGAGSMAALLLVATGCGGGGEEDEGGEEQEGDGDD